MPRKTPRGNTEDEIVHLLEDRFGSRHPSLVKGIGDDAAVVRPRGSQEFWVLTTDILLEDIDFRKDWITPRQLGHKALAVNLSDVAAMGARPRFHTVALGLPRGISQRWILAFYAGMAGLSERYRTILVGGDLSRSTSGIHISVVAIGETWRRKVVYRSGGKPGDDLYVTGVLGMSGAGLELLQSHRFQNLSSRQRDAIKAFRNPHPRCEVGLWLARHGFARAMMDLSDGLSSDLPRLCAASRTGSEIYTDDLPQFSDCRAWGADPLSLALHGGEDYELLFATSCSDEMARIYPKHFPKITRIGHLTRGSEVVHRTKPVSPAHPLPGRGFDHFSD